MKASYILRSASVLAALQFAAHLALILTYKPHHGAAEVAVVSAMQQNQFHFGGPWPHSYWDLYFGYALLAAISCLVEAVLFWMLFDAIQESPRSVRPIVGLFIAANLVHASIILRFFFLMPLFADLAVVFCLALALMPKKQARADARDRLAL